MSNHVCNLIIPGAPKSGTSSLHQALDQHASICMSSKKEPHYFSMQKRFVQGSGYHNALFEPKGRETVFGESSTGYLILPDAIGRIKQDLVNPKVIILLRDPVARTFSHYRWRFRLGLEKRSFAEAVQQDGYGYDPDVPDTLGWMCYLQFSQYATYCPLWLDAFGEENCLLLRAEEFRSSAPDVLRRCFRFLGVDDYHLEETFSANETDSVTAYPKRLMTQLASTLPKFLRASPTYLSFRNRVLSSLAPEPPQSMTEKERSYVTEQLKIDTEYYRQVFSI